MIAVIWIAVVFLSTLTSAVCREFLLRGVDWLSRRAIEFWAHKLQEPSRSEMREIWQAELDAILAREWHFSGLAFAFGLAIGFRRMRQAKLRSGVGKQLARVLGAIDSLFQRPVLLPAVMSGLGGLGGLAMVVPWPEWLRVVMTAWSAMGLIMAIVGILRAPSSRQSSQR